MAASKLAIAAWLALAATPVGIAMTLLPSDEPPVPAPRPSAYVDPSTTGAVIERFAGILHPEHAPNSTASTLRSGLDALASGDVDEARRLREALGAETLDRKVLAWAIARSGGSSVPSGEIAAAARTMAGWPGKAALREASERSMAREDPAPSVVVEAFAGTPPQTTEGAILLAGAHLALGDPEAARKAIAPLWRTAKLDAADEAAIIEQFGAIISQADHRVRMERMLHADRVRSAKRVAALAGAEELADAWAAVLRKDKDAAALLDAVPEAQRGAGHLFAKARHLRWQGRYAEAAAAMLSAPADASALADPDAWWIERRVLSREMLDLGEPEVAYRIAAGHAAQGKAEIADAEFHAGWYALRFLDDPAMAARHFARIAEIAEGPISLARAGYWQGRAVEAGAPGDAASHYGAAARHGATFYGQLASAKLGSDAPPIADPAASDADRARLAGREPVAAIARLEEAGHSRLADILYRDLARELDSPGEVALLAGLAESRGDHRLALRIGKIAAARGLDVGALAHPVGAIPADAVIAGAGAPLAYAIARQESEFNAGAVSPAGARGLLQLLPGTARDMAKKAGLDFSPARLTADAAYNATLGSTFLGEQIDRFDGSYVLTFAGYNAGPRRAEEWVERYGDPRGAKIEAVVDWIERIPYTETRNYVQRVMENYQVYKLRLAGRIDIEDDLVRGR